MTEMPRNIMTVVGKLSALKAEISMERKFLRKEIAPLLGKTGRSIQHYTDLGIVIPDIYNPTGKGTKRLYSEKNAFELLLIQDVIKHGFTLLEVKPIINAASEQWMKNPKSKTLMICTYKGSNSKKYDVQLYDESHVDLKIDLNGMDSILIIDISDIIRKISML